MKNKEKFLGPLNPELLEILVKEVRLMNQTLDKMSHDVFNIRTEIKNIRGKI